MVRRFAVPNVQTFDPETVQSVKRIDTASRDGAVGGANRNEIKKTATRSGLKVFSLPGINVPFQSSGHSSQQAAQLHSQH